MIWMILEILCTLPWERVPTEVQDVVVHYSIMASANSTTYGKAYVPEDPEVYHGRKALADQYISEGKSYKSAWYHADL